MSVAMPALRVRSRLRSWLRSASREPLSFRGRSVLQVTQLESREPPTFCSNPLMPNLLDPGEIRLVDPQLGRSNDDSSVSWLSKARYQLAADNAPLASPSSASSSGGSAACRSPSAADTSFSFASQDSLSSFSTDLFTSTGLDSSPSGARLQPGTLPSA